MKKRRMRSAPEIVFFAFGTLLDAEATPCAPDEVQPRRRRNYNNCADDCGNLYVAATCETTCASVVGCELPTQAPSSSPTPAPPTPTPTPAPPTPAPPTSAPTPAPPTPAPTPAQTTYDMEGETLTTDIYFDVSTPAQHFDTANLAWGMDIPYASQGVDMRTIIKFDIPSTITGVKAAFLELYVTSPNGEGASLHEMVVDWENTAFTSFGSSWWETANVATTSGLAGTSSVDVTASVQKWQAGTAPNYGWIFLPTGTPGATIASSSATVGKPKLSITYPQLTCDTFSCPTCGPTTCLVSDTPINRGSGIACTGICDVAQCCVALSYDFTSTNLLFDHFAGDTTIYVEQHIGNIGETLVIDWNTALEESVVVAGYGSILLQNPLQFDHVGGTAVFKAAWTPSAIASMQGDPITYIGGRKIPFSLPANTLTLMLETPRMRVLAAPFPGKDASKEQWVGQIVVTTADKPALNVLRVDIRSDIAFFNRSNIARDAFETIQVVLPLNSQSPLTTMPPRDMIIHGPSGIDISFGVVRNVEHGPLPDSMPRQELVCVNDGHVSIFIESTSAFEYYGVGDLSGYSYAHLDMYLPQMPPRNVLASFKGVLPQLWGFTPLSDEVHAMKKAAM